MPEFKQVDVFTSAAFKGNPVAVFFDADGLSTEEMQTIARWTNLSETTFVLKPTTPEADYQLRIFTPSCELPFAGHPTIGSAHAVLEKRLVSSELTVLVQECKAGLVQINTGIAGPLRFKLPYYKHSKFAKDLGELSSCLGIKVSDIKSIVEVDDGPIWLTIQLGSGELVRELKPDFSSLGAFGDVSIFGKSEDGTYEARNFFRQYGLYVEDPVCGSGAGADASVLAELEGFEGDLIIRQGREVGRDGFINVTVVKGTDDEHHIYVGGNAITVLDGVYNLQSVE